MINKEQVDKLVIDRYCHDHNIDHCQQRTPPLFGVECFCLNMPSVIASNPSSSCHTSPTSTHTHNHHHKNHHHRNHRAENNNNNNNIGFSARRNVNSEQSDSTDCMMDSLNDVLVENGQVDMDRDRSYQNSTRMDQSEAEEMAQSDRCQLVPTGTDDLEDELPNSDSTVTDEKGHLAIPEIIEILKNLAACKEKLFKWEQSVSNLASIPDTDPNKSHLMEIIDFVENTKSSTKEKAIYLYEQLGSKCRQHKNYIGAAKAYERAASLRLDISDLNETGDNRESIVSSTIRYLESAIENYDTIHKFKHAGTLHYRCSKILKMMNASHEEVDRHHEKALEYFTKPDHELKHRKRIDGLKISCYSSFSTLQRMHHEIEKFHTTTTTTTTNTIKFHADGCFRDSEDSDSNHSTTPPPSSSGSAHGSTGPMTPAIQFYGEDRHDYHNQNPPEFFDSFMGDNFFEPSDRTPGGDVHAMEGGASGTGGSTMAPNGSVSMSKSATMEKSSSTKSSSGNRLHHSHHYQHEAMSAVKDHHHHYHHHHVAKATTSHHRHLQSASSSSSSFSAFQKHHKTSSTSGMPISSPLNPLHPSNLHKTTFRCIEDRIESARKLVKKLHKLCPFYEVSTNGDDAGRVYCRICDRYLGAVSSTLKNHVNTQEHRQAYEDSQQPSGPSGTQQPNPYSANGASSSTPALPAPHALPALPAPPATPSNGAIGSYSGNLTSNSTGNSREDLTGGYTSGSNNNNPNTKTSSASNYSAEQPQPQQLILQPGLSLSPFMIQASPIAYQSTIQSLDKTGHLSSKYIDYDQLSTGANQNANSEQQQQQMNWAAAAAAVAANAVNNQSTGGTGYGNGEQSAVQTQSTTPQQYLSFNGNGTANLNNLLTFTDAGGNPAVSIIDASTVSSKQAMAAAVLQMQSNLGGHHHHPHYAIPSAVALGTQNVASNGNGNSGNNASNNMPVLAYH